MRFVNRAAMTAPLLIVAASFPAPARADLSSLHAACAPRTAIDPTPAGAPALTYVFCDDGVPSAGGTNPNPGAVKALAVPERYAGYAGLPAKAVPYPGAGADPSGDVALDADVTLPDPA